MDEHGRRPALMPAGLVSFTERGSGPPLLLIHGVMITGEMFGRSSTISPSAIA